MMSLNLKSSLSMAGFFKLLLILFAVIASNFSYAGVWGEGKWGTMKWGVESDDEVPATTSEIQVTETYIGLLDRAPDPDGKNPVIRAGSPKEGDRGTPEGGSSPD